MSNYYFLVSLLPQLEIGNMPKLGFSELKELLRVNLSSEDLQKVKQLLALIDYENFRSIWSGEPIDRRGNFNKEELEQALADQTWPNGEEFPDYLKDFLSSYQSPQERVQHFGRLMSAFIEDNIVHREGFLREFFSFEREKRLVLVGFRAKKMKKNIDAELQFEDPNEPLVAQILAQKDAKVYEPPFEFKDLKPVFDLYGDNPTQLHKSLLEYSFQKYIDLKDSKHFSIDNILSYIARLLIVEKWLELDVQRGIEIIDTIERKIQ